jgi:hypothetical protein
MGRYGGFTLKKKNKIIVGLTKHSTTPEHVFVLDTCQQKLDRSLYCGYLNVTISNVTWYV